MSGRSSSTQSSGAGAVEPISIRLQKVVMTLQFLWFLGHVTTVLQTILVVMSGGKSNYYKAYYGTLLSYGIILYKAHGVPQFNQAFLQRIVTDENSQYFMLSFIWVTSNPIIVTLIPYATFSLFHVLGYFRTEFIPKVFPGDSFPPVKSLIPFLVQASTYQGKALSFVSFAEVWAILPMTIISIFWGRVSLFTPFLYFQFLSFRYMFSPLTKQAVRSLEVALDKWIGANPSIPPAVKNVYEKAKGLVKTYGDLESRARAAQGQATPPPQ